MADNNRRDSERIDVLGSLPGDVTVVQSTQICQMSRGGMLVETQFPLQVDSLHDFRLLLQDLSIVVKGRVAHSRISDVDRDVVTYQAGIEFVEPSDPVASAIGEFIEALRVQRERV